MLRNLRFSALFLLAGTALAGAAVAAEPPAIPEPVDKRYPDELKRSVFAGFSDAAGWYGKDDLINAEFDPKTRTLSALEMGRGLATAEASRNFSGRTIA